MDFAMLRITTQLFGTSLISQGKLASTLITTLIYYSDYGVNLKVQLAHPLVLLSWQVISLVALIGCPLKIAPSLSQNFKK